MVHEGGSYILNMDTVRKKLMFMKDRLNSVHENLRAAEFDLQEKLEQLAQVEDQMVCFCIYLLIP